MSANLDLVRSIYADWERGDFSRTDWADPQIEYVVHGVSTTTRWGNDGMLEGFRDWIRVWSDWAVSADDYVVLDANRILVMFEQSARMKASAADADRVRRRGATLFDVRDELITRIVQYMDRDRALADFGLED